jgi:hypothetical protein
MESILNKTVSYYPENSATEKGIDVNLLKLLKTYKHKAIIERLRAETDIDRQKAIKATLSCYTVAGTFSTRSNAGLLIPSGLACVDLDAAEDFEVLHLSNELRKLPYLGYCGLSCRGKRLFLIVPFATPDYDRHYERLIQSFTDMGLPMGDQCHKSISQPRYVSYNDETTHWFNHSAKLYHLLPVKRTVHLPCKVSGNTSDNPFEIVERILKKQGNNFQDGNKHNYIFGLCCWLNKMGVPKVEAENYIYTELLPPSTIKSNCIEYPYKHYSTEFGTFNFDTDSDKKYSPPVESEHTIDSTNIREFALHEPEPITLPIAETSVEVKEKCQANNYICPTANNIAYVDSAGKLFIETPLAGTYTVYPSINHYNKRVCIPEFAKKHSVDIAELNQVFINLNTLTIEAMNFHFPATIKTEPILNLNPKP